MEKQILCPYCGVGCRVKLVIEDGKVRATKPDPDDPVSEGKPCIKGLNCHQSIYAEDRIKQPLIRKSKDSELKPVSWEEAYDFIYDKLSKLEPHQMAFYGSSPSTNEDNYLLQKFAKEVLNCRNIDSCARLCHATTCYSFNKAFGMAAMPARIDDFKEADCILILGSNPKTTYPVAFNKILETQKNGAKLICIRNWKDDTAQHADIYLEIQTGTELAFLNTILSELVERKAVEVPEELKEILKEYTLENITHVCNIEGGMQICKVLTPELKKIIDEIEKSKKFVLGFGMGITQHVYGVQNVLGAINLAVAKKGKIISMRGKANIQGVGDMGCLPSQGGDTFISSVFANNTKAIYVMESNPAQSMPDLNQVHKKFKEFFIVTHTTYPNTITEFADVVLPCTSWAERSGCYTNAESRVRFFNKVIEPLHETKPNWLILSELMKKFGKEGYKEVTDVTKEILEKVKGYNLDYEKLINGKTQFVNRKEKFQKFSLVKFEEVEEPVSKEYPYIMTTERLPYNFCTNEMSERSETLSKLAKASCSINKQDAEKLNLKDDDLIEVRSKVGELQVKVKITENVPRGLINIPFHFKDILVNKLIPLEFSPLVEEPNLKRVAVNINKL